MVRIRRRRIALLRETLYEAPMPGGLTAVLVPRKGFVQKAAALATRYGSLDMRFALGAGREATDTPAGVAHFLEHQLFKKADGDALMRFSRYGASANAFTDYTQTAYHFVCSDRFEESLRELVTFVMTPDFEAGRVEKEKSIITQELRMYRDMPDMRGYQNLLSILYREHPVRIDIGGTIESIQAITPGVLDLCHRAFYSPSNMLLVMAGDLDPQEAFRIALDELRKRVPADRRGGGPRAATLLPVEPEGPGRPEIREKMVVSRPRVLIGFKDRVERETPEQTARRHLETSLLLDLLFGRASVFYNREYETGLINDEFGAGYSSAESFGFTVLGGETEDPAGLVEAVRREIEAAASSGKTISAADLRRLQRKSAGQLIGAFDGSESAAFVVLETLLRRVPLESLVEIIFAIRPEDLRRRLDGHLRRPAVSIVEP